MLPVLWLCLAWPAAAAESPRIVTTTAQIADMVRHITGDLAQVVSLMGEGVDPHTYRQSRRDVVLLRNADLIIANGLYLEAQLEPLLEALSSKQRVLIARRVDFAPAHSLAFELFRQI